MAKAGENFIQDHRPTQDAPEIVQFDDHYSRRDTGVPVRMPQMAMHLQIHADTLPLTELLDSGAQDKGGKGLHGNSPCGRDYGKLVTRLAQSIADLQGLYIWGYYESNGLWRTIYLGKAGLGRTASLRARITEELKEERALIWRGKHSGLDDEALERLWPGHYPPSPGSKASENHVKRALSKAGSTHIIWVATPEIDNGHVARIEADLIETLNPSANVQRPAPTSGLQEMTVSVIQRFKAEMHRYRPTPKTSTTGR